MENIKLYNDDCMVGMKSLADESIDMICADLPYGLTGNKWDIPLDLTALFKEYMRIIKDNGCIALFSCQPFTTDVINAGRKWFRYEIIWEKSNGTDFFNVKKKPLRSHENILIFYKNQPKYNPQMEKGKPYKKVHDTEKEGLSTTGYIFKRRGEVNNTGTRFPKTILKFAREQGKHTTQKPVPLLEWFIKTYTDEGELVLDNTMGSGTCGVACVNLHRRFIGWELDTKIFEVADKRIKDLFLTTD